MQRAVLLWQVICLSVCCVEVSVVEWHVLRCVRDLCCEVLQAA